MLIMSASWAIIMLCISDHYYKWNFTQLNAEQIACRMYLSVHFSYFTTIPSPEKEMVLNKMNGERVEGEPANPGLCVIVCSDVDLSLINPHVWHE